MMVTLLFGVIFTFGLLTNAQPPFSLPPPDPVTGTVESTATATGFLPDTGSNWFDSKHHSLDDNVGKPFIPGPESPLSIYNKPEVLDPFYAKTNVFHHHHHFIIPVHRHVKHIHHHHHHNHHIHHHTHPISIQPQTHHYYHHHRHHHHKIAHINPSTLVGVVDHDENHHDYKQLTNLHPFGTDVQGTNSDFNAAHNTNTLAIDPSVADTVSVPMIKTAQQHQIHEPVINHNAIAPGPLAASQTAYGVPNTQTNWAHSISSHQVDRDTANTQVYGHNLNMLAATQGITTGINEFNNPLTGTSAAVNTVATQPAMNSATFDNHPSSETLLDSTSAQSLPNANSLSGGIIPLNGDTEILSKAQTKSETGTHLMDSKPIARDHNSLQPALTMNHDIANGDATSVANIHPTPEQTEIGQEVHHFVADSNDNELHEINNLPLQFFSQGHKVTTVGDHASLEADHGIVEAGLSDAHPDHHIFDSLHEHNQEEDSVEHVMPSTGAIHVTEDSHGHVHKHINDWNEAEHNGLHDLHVEESHNKQPYAIHVSDNGHGYAVQAEEYHDHEDGHVEHRMENDFNHIVGLSHADHIISNQGMNDHENTDQGIIDHGISNHEYIQHGAADHGIVDHGIIDHGIIDHGVIDHGIFDHGIVNHGVTEHGIIDHGATEHGSIDHDIGDHEITDAVADVDAIGDHEAILHQNNHVAVEIGHSNEEIIDHEVPVQHEANDHHSIVSQEIHDPGIHVNFHAIEHGNELYDGVNNPEHSEVHINSPIPMNTHAHEEITHTVEGPVTESHATTSVAYEHLHEEPHIELHHDDHRDYHDGGIAPELVETNIHSNSVPEYNGNNPMTYLHDVTGHETGHDVRHDIHELATHDDTLNAGMPITVHDGIPGDIHAGFHDVSHHEVHENMPPISHELATAGHSAEEHAHASNMINEQVHASHDLGVHGFDEHGEEFLINREVQHLGEQVETHAQRDDTNPVDRSEDNQVHLDEKDAELLKKAKENEIIDPPYLTHLDPHGDGFGEGVVGGPDLNIGNSLQAGAAISSSFPATIPNSPPFVGNHPAAMVQNGNIAPDYGSKRQKFEHENIHHVKSGYVSIGDPKKGNTVSSKIASNSGIIRKVGSAKTKLSKFIKGGTKDSMSFFANDREKKAEEIFETIPNEPRILSNTDQNKGKRKENSKGSTKITSLGVQKENEHNITNGASSNEGSKKEDHNGTKVETNGKDKEQSTEMEENKDRNSKNFGGTIDGGMQNGTESKNDVEKEEENGKSSNEKKANDATEEKVINEKKIEETLKNGTLKFTNQNKSGNKTSQKDKVRTKNEKNMEEEELKQATLNNETETSVSTTKIKESLVGSNQNRDSSANAKHGIKHKVKAEETKSENKKLESKDSKQKDKKSTKEKSSQGTKNERTENESGNSTLNENNEEESTIDKVKTENDTMSIEKVGNTSKVSRENVENLDARDFASGSGEGSGDADGGKGKKVTKIEHKKEQSKATSNKENFEAKLKSKDKNKNDENSDGYEKMSTQNNTKQSAKERTKFSNSKKVDKTKNNNENKGENDRNLNKSKSKGKKGDKSRNDNKENENLGDDKGTEQNADSKTDEKLKEDITQKNSTIAAQNVSKNIAEVIASEGKKMEGFMADNNARQPSVKYMQKESSSTTSSDDVETSNTSKYGLHVGSKIANGYANKEEKGSREGSGNGEIQEVDEEGRIIERSKDAEEKEKITQESNDENGFEKVGPQKNASSRIDNKDAAKSEEEINVSVDKEEWKSNEENNEGKQSRTKDQEPKEIYRNEENHGIGDSSNGFITTEQDDLQQETGPTESPTQFYLSDKGEGSGNTETPADFASMQSDNAQAPAEKNSHELDVVANSGKTYTRENEESTGMSDPIDIIEGNTATVRNAKNDALEEKELFGGDSGNSATYSSLEDKSNIGRQKPTDALIRKRHQLPRHRQEKEPWRQASKNKKSNLATRLKSKRKKRYIGRISNAKITEKKRTRRRAYLSDIFRRALLIRRISQGYQR